ncbi:protein FAR1-RELATED SEQUENCE 5-like [Phalaenopsis equestris]|uniref:protein FAR1-RELATED SEQUENCE 5-like n=1 Tax=Phalaenopsis equestris TaxID=78828 RepID=UPI0009E21D59|nr:protein FAR1-RELATED SEQUENCE 5-like [Phalaenopsis equestris]
MAHDSGEQCPTGLNDCSNGDLDQVAICFPDEWIPKVDMEFETEQEAYDFYNRYAFEMGFSIRKSSRHLLRKGGEVKDRTFCCSREGIRGKDRRKENVQTPRYETRCNCNAKLKISLRNGKYYVFQFIPEHNHELATRTQVHRLRSHRHIIPAQPVTTLGVSSKPAFDLMSADVDGHENLGFILDFGNDLRTEQSITIKGGNSGGVLEYLKKMQLEDPKFFYSVQLDKLHTTTNVFWADSRMIADYENFGDVVCFDMTYGRLNIDNGLFGLLLGVNNHKQLIVFGAALLHEETFESFKWLFDTFLKAMLGNKPKTVFTDDNIAMAKAIKICLPETNHRLCVWQIGQNICQQLSEVVRDYKSFGIDFSSCIYDHDEEATFLDSWNSMLVKYKLFGNVCLHSLFEKREQWALVYERNVFQAGLCSAQRTDTMIKELKNSFNADNDILAFFQRLERLVQGRRYEELKADIAASQSMPKLKFNLEILKHAARIYTPVIFKMFQDEVLQTWNCDMHFFGENGFISTHKLKTHGKIQEHTVIFDSSNVSVECSCKNFEFIGILCTHALKVLDFKNIRTIPDSYLLKRWMKDAKMMGVAGPCAPCLDPKIELRRRYKELCRLFIQVAAKAAETEETYAIAVGQVSKLLQEVEKRLRRRYKPDPEGENTELNGLDVELGQTMEGDVSSREQMQTRKLKGIEQTTNKKKKKIRLPQISVGAAEQNLSDVHLNNDVYNPTSDPVQRHASSSMGREAPQDNFRQHPEAQSTNLWLDLSQPSSVGVHTNLLANNFQLQPVQANSFSPGIYQIHHATTTIPLNQQGHLNMLQQIEPQIHSLRRQLFLGSAEG